MNFLKNIKTLFAKQQSNKKQIQEQAEEIPPAFLLNSFQLLISDILDDPPTQQFTILCPDKDAQPSEGVQNMYVKDFLMIGKRCNGRELSIQQWNDIIKSGDLSAFSKKDIYFSIFKGIDHSIRRQVWQILSNTKGMQIKYKRSYHELLGTKLNLSDLDLIDKDVARTGSVTTHLDQLRDILRAYVALSGRGYTQGMNLITGVLLRVLSRQNESKAGLSQCVLWLLVGIMEEKGWAEVYQQNLSGITKHLQTLKCLMTQHVPVIYNIITSLEWDLGIFAQYYVTICLYNCPCDLAPILLDLFLLDGQNIIHSLIIRMLVLNQQKIVGYKDESQLMKFLKQQMMNQTYTTLLKNRDTAHCLEDFQINFLNSYECD